MTDDPKLEAFRRINTVLYGMIRHAETNEEQEIAAHLAQFSLELYRVYYGLPTGTGTPPVNYGKPPA